MPNRLSREATSGLRRIHEGASRDLELVLGDLFESDVRGSVVAVEQARYSRFIDRLPSRAYHAVFAARGLDGDVQLVLGGNTALAIIDRVLRREGRSDRGLTLVDQHLLVDLAPSLMRSIEEALRPHCAVELSLVRSELNAQLVKLLPGDDVVVVVELLFTIGDHDLTIVVAYPHTALEPLLAALSAAEQAATQAAMTKSTPIRRSILRVPIPVTVRLPSMWLPASEVRELAVGDVLQTGVAVDTPPVLTIDGRPALSVLTTSHRSRLACVVVGRYGSKRATKGCGE
ncbi:MAG: FliM/FliN family flagellar motor switch protein [Acidimicrobiales bacterium]